MPQKREQNVKNTIKYIFLGTALVVGFFLGILYKTLHQTTSTFGYKQIRINGYEYINPLIDFEDVKSADITELVNLEKELNGYTKQAYSTKDVTQISVYYKDLNSGAWIGINENQDFAPASLLKLPTVIAVLKIAESDPDILKQKFTFHKESTDVPQNFVPSKHLEEGKEYTLDEMIERVLKYSDNEALRYVFNSISYDQLIGIYKELGIDNPYANNDSNMMNVKEYATFFRILYNASYLNKEMSTKVLKLLSESEYDNGLAKGIPNGIKIANKFGERGYTDNTSEEKQLHDCGIIYTPEQPYLLCVMTKGHKFSSLETVISDISKSVFNRINSK